MTDTPSRATAVDDAGRYLLGYDEAELRRLSFQHRVWALEAHALWRRAELGRGDRVADVGCGPGFATVELAHLVGPEGRVVAIDSDPRSLDYLEARARAEGLANVERLEADVQHLELPAASLDGAYCRWLLCFVRDPEAVVARVAAALVPGGRLAVTDYFNYRAFTFAPRSAALDRVVAAVEEAWRQGGGDLEIQGRLPAMMARHGLRLADVSTSARVARPGSPAWGWPRGFFDAFLPKLLAAGLIGEGDRDAFEADWRARSADPNAFLSLPPMYDLIGIRE